MSKRSRTRQAPSTSENCVAMIVILTVLLRLFLNKSLLAEAKVQADKGVAGRMEGHATMDMAVTKGPLLRRLTSPEGLPAVSHYFIMDWASLWLDLIVGLLIAGALAAPADSAATSCGPSHAPSAGASTE